MGREHQLVVAKGKSDFVVVSFFFYKLDASPATEYPLMTTFFSLLRYMPPFVEYGHLLLIDVCVCVLMCTRATIHTEEGDGQEQFACLMVDGPLSLATKPHSNCCLCPNEGPTTRQSSG